MDIPGRILDELQFLASINTSDDWMPVKKHLLKSVPSKMRTKFSTRDPKTKRQSLNSFERKLIDVYETLTGTQLRLYNE